jgi:hypothetical protein
VIYTAYLRLVKDTYSFIIKKNEYSWGLIFYDK